MEEKLKVVKMSMPNGIEYWCLLDEMFLVMQALRVAHPEWLGKEATFTQVDMAADEYYRRPATDDPISAAVEVVRSF